MSNNKNFYNMKKSYTSPKSESVTFNVEGVIAASSMNYNPNKDAMNGQWVQKKNPIWD